MAENTARPPVAIRIVRPYQSEDEFLENELETVGKTSVILIGAHSRPTGVILRFEVTLASGATILRGEGRVLAFKENAFRGQAGLSLRFTRLDPKSKALVDRAAAIREAKAAGDPAPMSVRPSAPPPAPSAPQVVEQAPARSRPPSRRAPPPSQPDVALADALTAETPPPPSRRSSRPSAPPREVMERPASIPPQPPAVLSRSSDPPGATLQAEASEPHLAPAPPPPPVSAVAAGPSSGSSRTVDRPANRDELLARLRDRAASLPPDRVDHILAKR